MAAPWRGVAAAPPPRARAPPRGRARGAGGGPHSGRAQHHVDDVAHGQHPPPPPPNGERASARLHVHGETVLADAVQRVEAVAVCLGERSIGAAEPSDDGDHPVEFAAASHDEAPDREERHAADVAGDHPGDVDALPFVGAEGELGLVGRRRALEHVENLAAIASQDVRAARCIWGAALDRALGLGAAHVGPRRDDRRAAAGRTRFGRGAGATRSDEEEKRRERRELGPEHEATNGHGSPSLRRRAR